MNLDPSVVTGRGRLKLGELVRKRGWSCSRQEVSNSASKGDEGTAQGRERPGMSRLIPIVRGPDGWVQGGSEQSRKFWRRLGFVCSV